MTPKRQSPALAGIPGLVKTAESEKFSTDTAPRTAHLRLVNAVRPIDTIAARRMLEVIAGNGPLTFQTFDESDAKQMRLSKVKHGTLDAHLPEFERLQGLGAGVFVLVNEGDGRGRKAANVRAVRAVFVDLDGAPLGPVQAAALPPHLIVETSPGKYHAYWRVSDCPLERFKEMQLALAAKFKADPAVSDLSRVMRLVGCWHLKAAPFQSRIIADTPREPYTLVQLCEGLELDLQAAALAKAQGPGPILEGERNDALFRMAASFRNQGLPRDTVLARIRTANAKRCKPPLDDAELQAIVDRAFSYAVQGGVWIEYGELDSPAYVEASMPARALYVEARRRYAASKRPVSLTLRDLRSRRFSTQKALSRCIRECCALGLLKEVQPARWGHAGSTRQAALYVPPLVVK